MTLKSIIDCPFASILNDYLILSFSIKKKLFLETFGYVPNFPAVQFLIALAISPSIFRIAIVEETLNAKGAFTTLGKEISG